MANLWSPEQRVTPQQLFSVLSEKFHDVVEIYPGDSEREKQFAKMRYYLCAVKTTINEAAQYAAASDYPTYIGVLGHQIEMGLRHCYKSVLPADYQLSVPLFEDTMSDVEFFTALENDYINRANNSPIPMLTAVSIYHEYLIMAKSYVPKCPMEASVNTEELLRRF
ncbi:hypothetical protein BDF20DRAFT_812816, partial [Mycotypha africana]|uniref:uncharacterized protein n=1 Tax=Mycotypha africana TaxID=64632 RepID=UPI0022FFC96F